MNALIFLPLLATLSLLVTAVTAVSVFLHVRRSEAPSDASSDAELPPISVLKPLKGVDEGLYENLASLARQDYPCFELVLGVAEADDPALEVVERLQRDFPHVPMTVVAGSRALGLNPKVSNLAAMSPHARYEWRLVSDSDVRAGPSYLLGMAKELADPRVGLVTNVFTGVGGEGSEAGLGETAGAILDNLHLGTFVAGSIAAASRMGHPLVGGKSMLFRGEDLEDLGGWLSVRNILAEDYVLGRRFGAAGHRVALARQPLTVIHRRRPLRGFIGRHLRWSQMRRRISLTAYLGEPLLNPTPWLAATLVAALAGAGFGGWAATPVALLATAGLGLKVTLDGLQLGRLSGRRPTLRELAWVPAKDLLIFALWAIGLFRRDLDWRGNRLRVAAGSELTAPKKDVPAWVEELLATPPARADEAQEAA